MEEVRKLHNLRQNTSNKSTRQSNEGFSMKCLRLNFRKFVAQLLKLPFLVTGRVLASQFQSFQGKFEEI